MTQTAQATDWWVQHGQRAGAPWGEYYWNDWQAPHRSHILLAMAMLGPPIDSVYEIGANAAPNLRLLRSTWNHLKLRGQELCKEAVEVAGQHGFTLDQGTLPESLIDQPDQSVDVVLSCYTLAYLDEQDAQQALNHMTRMARRAIILLEPIPMVTVAPGLCRTDGLPEWRHAYDQAVWQRPWALAWKWPVLPPAGNLNGCVVFSRTRNDDLFPQRSQL